MWETLTQTGEKLVTAKSLPEIRGGATEKKEHTLQQGERDKQYLRRERDQSDRQRGNSQRCLQGRTSGAAKQSPQMRKKDR